VRKLFALFVIASLIGGSVFASENPFYAEWDTPYGVPDFSLVKNEHYMPAFEGGMKQEKAEVETIAKNTEPPTFANTIEALEATGVLLERVSNVFFNLNSSNTNDEMQDIAKEVAPMLSQHGDEIYLNAELFVRVKTVYDKRADLGLNTEQMRLLEEYYKDFVRGGANLDPAQKEEFSKINERLSVLSLQFGENVLDENNAFELVIEDEADLAGLNDGAIQGAVETAEERGHEGKWVFTLHKPSMIPFLTYSDKRELREKIYKAYINKGNNANDLDNKNIINEMVSLRVRRAQLLGYDTHADYILDRRMAKEPEAVYDLLDKLWTPALARAKAEVDEMQAMIDEEGGDFKLESWDWWYYAEKVKKAKYDFDDEALRPYFELSNVRKGAFEVAGRLFGITFVPRNDIPTYHEDVEVFEVKDADGSHIGIYYVDYFPRASKRGGAWMNSIRKQSRMGGEEVTPVIVNVGNLSKPTEDTPSLLSVDEVSTLWHEFGHGLHGLLSDCTYDRLSGTAVAWDFVEMPSQVMENWAMEPEVLALYARHYETGELIPDELVAKMKRAKHFNQGFATTEYLAASILDMDWHTLNNVADWDVLEFEDQSLNRIGLIPEIISRYRSPYFRHIFSGGYSSGYYSYIWAEVLDADAFEAFKQNGILDHATGMKFREIILARGGTEDPMVLFKRFRGADPTIEPLLKRRGLD
jgi:peptidyl-dipeptidase Dcp